MAHSTSGSASHPHTQLAGKRTGYRVAEPNSPVTSQSALHHFFEILGPDARNRPSVELTVALAGAGGAAIAAGLAVAIVGGSDANRVHNVMAAAAVLVLAYVILFRVKRQPELRSAAVGAAAIGIPGLAGAITDVGDGGGTLLLAAGLFVAAWALPGLRARPTMLGAGAVAVVFALATIGDATVAGSGPFDFRAADISRGNWLVFVLAALMFLGMVWWLDEHGVYGVGTSLVIAAIVATTFGIIKVVEDLGSTPATVSLAIAGLAAALVGGRGQREATKRFGVTIFASGTVAAVASVVGPRSPIDIALVFTYAGLVLVLVPAAVKQIHAYVDLRGADTDN
jgi:hypothetical protein